MLQKDNYYPCFFHMKHTLVAIFFFLKLIFYFFSRTFQVIYVMQLNAQYNVYLQGFCTFSLQNILINGQKLLTINIYARDPGISIIRIIL